MSRYRSKTLTAWIAVIGGTLGLHRFYLKGFGDGLGWLYPLPTLAGLLGLQRFNAFGVDDRLAWMLTPWLGLSISMAMLSAIVHGLTSDADWDARHNPGQPSRKTGWAPVLAVIAALLSGSVALISTIAFSVQKLFELTS